MEIHTIPRSGYIAYADEKPQESGKLTVCGEPTVWSCNECEHDGKEWDEDPCDGCTGSNSGFEKKRKPI